MAFDWQNGPAGGTPLSAARLNQLAFLDEISAVVAYELGNPTSDVTLAMQSMFAGRGENVVSVKDYGAKGDGVTDDTAAFAAAFGDGPIHLFVPDGTYLVSDTILIPSNSSMVGQSRDGAIIRAVDTMVGTVDVVATANRRTDGVEHTDYVENVVIANLTVDGRAFDRPYPAYTGWGCNIVLTTVRNALVQNVRTINGLMHCLDIRASQYLDDGNVNHQPAGPSRYVTIRDVIAVDSRQDDGITTHNSGDIVIDGCRVLRTRPLVTVNTHGIEVDEGSYRVFVNDCYVTGVNSGFQVKGHTTTTPARDVTLTNCVAEGCGVSFQLSHVNPSALPGGQTSEAKNVSLINCVSLNPVQPDVTGSSAETAALYVTAYRNVQVRNLVIRGGSGTSANHVRLGDGADNVTIDGLYMAGAGASMAADRGFIHAFASYGQGSNLLAVRNVVCETSLFTYVVRTSSANTHLVADGITAVGTSGPALFIGAVQRGTQVTRINTTGYAATMTVSQFTAAGTWSAIDILPGYRLLAYGSGTPEGAVTAPPGTQYVNTAGGSTPLFVKRTGTGNTGWQSYG